MPIHVAHRERNTTRWVSPFVDESSASPYQVVQYCSGKHTTHKVKDIRTDHFTSQSVSHSTPSPPHDWIPQSHTRLWPIWDWSHATAYTSNSQRRLLQPKCLGASPDSVWATSLHAPVVGGRYPWWPYRLRMLPAN